MQPAGPIQGVAPSLPAEPGAQPIVTGGGGIPAPSGKVFTATEPKTPGLSRFRVSKKLAIPVIAVLVLLVGSAAAYFGYYENPSVIYRQSLSNTGKGYNSLIDYLDQQSKANTKGYSGSGSYSVKSSGYTTDGKLAYKSDGQNTDFSFDLGADVTRVSTDIRAIKSTGDTPDIYFKVSGIKGLGTSLGDPSLDPYLNKLDSQWIVVDHTLIDSLENEISQSGATKHTSPTKDQILDEARAAGTVNQQYVFTTDNSKAVMKIVKKYGKETVDGHSTYHYQMALQPANVKKYILAQRDALTSSKLDAWLKQNHYETSVINSFNQAANSTKDINSSDDFDLWVDASHRIVYKVRVNDHPNPAENYVDIGLNYKGGDDYPLFISGKSQDTSSNTTYNLSMTSDINTKTHAIGFNLSEKSDGSDAVNVSSNFSLSPNTGSVTIAKPSGAIPLSQVLSELGLDSSSSSSSLSGSSSAISLSKQLSANGSPAEAVKSALLTGLLNR